MEFTAEHEMFRQSVRRFVAEEINPHVDAWEEAEAWPAHTVLKQMGDLGFLGLTYPEEYGGLALDDWYMVVLFEELARIDCGGVPMGLAVHCDMCTPALAKYGTPELKERFLAPAIRGEQLGAIGVSEPDAGSDVAGIRTRAVADGEDWVINGKKLYITNGVQADWLCLLARTSDEGGYRGMSLIVVPTKTPGFSVGRKLKKLGNHSSDTAELWFEEMRVPRANTIGLAGRGFQMQMQQFQRERLVGAILTYSSIAKMIRHTIDYTKQRHAFGRPLIANQVIAFRLAELLSENEHLRQMCYVCARKSVAGEDYTREASMAKLKAGRLVREVADSCLQFFGGMGYMAEMPVARFFRDSRLTSIGGGADEVMLDILCKIEGIGATERRA